MQLPHCDGAVSPRRALADADWTALSADLDDLPADDLSWAAANLGKRSTAGLTGVRHFVYHHRQVVLVGAVVVAVAGVVALVAHVAPPVGIALIVIAIAAGVGGFVMNRSFASPLPLRCQVLSRRCGTDVALEDDADAEQVRELADLPRGDRRRWIDHQITIGGAAPWQLGVYRYEDESTDTDANGNTSTSYSTRSRDYVFIPAPADLTVESRFSVGHKSLFSRSSDLGLASAFTRVYAVRTDGSEQSRMFVTRALAPDAQALLLDAPDHKVSLHVGPEGTFLVGDDFGLRKLGRAGRGPDVKAAIAPYVAVLHEIYEAINPAYKQL